jgi:hypothetical protein
MNPIRSINEMSRMNDLNVLINQTNQINQINQTNQMILRQIRVWMAKGDRERDNRREERPRIKFGASKGGAEGLMGVAARKRKIHP